VARIEAEMRPVGVNKSRELVSDKNRAHSGALFSLVTFVKVLASRLVLKTSISAAGRQARGSVNAGQMSDQATIITNHCLSSGRRRHARCGHSRP
jgi:hypothetical protein